MPASRLRGGSRAPLLAAIVLALAPGARSDPNDGPGVPGHPAPQRSAAAFMRAGDAAMGTGDFTSAIAFYRRAAALTPRDPAPVVRLGEALAKSGAPAAALEAYAEAHARDPRAPAIELAMGRLALTLDRPEEALSDFQAAAGHAPSASAWNGIGVAHDAAGDHQEAQRDYRKGLAINPRDNALRNNLGLSQALAGDYPAAIATLKALVAEPGASAGERLNLALVYGLSGDNDKAASTAREVLGEADNAANLRYYALLRSMDDRARTRAILGLGPTPATPSPGPAGLAPR